MKFEMMVLAIPFSMFLYSLLNMANWLNYEITGTLSLINLILKYNNYVSIRFHFSRHSFLPIACHSSPSDRLLHHHNFARQRFHQFTDSFFENGMEDCSRASYVWDDGRFN